MKSFFRSSLLALLTVSGLVNALPKYKATPDIQYSFGGMLKEDMFGAHNLSLLNNNNPGDNVWFERHTLDLSFNLLYGAESVGYPLSEFNFTIRNKAIWGNANTIAETTSSSIKLLDVVTGEHSHFIPRMIFWMRECWLRFSVPDALQLHLNNPHNFMLGFFPYQLGRGISLGDAYAVGQDFLGFYTDGLVDQFAPAFKLAGEFIKDRLHYDLYAAILENFSAVLSDTSAKINAQRYGRRLNPSRGFGSVNYAVAGRLRWYPMPIDSPKKLIIEPYWLFNRDPEVDVEFTADSETRLATFGIACDYVSDRIETGFEYAFNIGRQEVFGWDRNVIQMQNRNGQTIFVNSHVVIGVDPEDPSSPKDLSMYQVQHAPNSVNPTTGAISDLGKKAQTAINNNEQNETQNGQLITVVPGLRDILTDVPNAVGSANPDALYNKKNRYRNPYDNAYKGMMFVADLALWMHGKDVRLGFEGGLATGDDNPNFETKDGDYAGFVGLQEVYSGRKVRSAFVLGGAGKIKRPIGSAPTTLQAPTEFTQTVSGFSNLVYLGTSVLWIPSSACKRFSFQPNVLAFWQESKSPKFDALTKKNLPEAARNFLGFEGNLFSHYMLFDALKLFFIGSVFIPGGHYTDIKGLPLNSEQSKALDKLDPTGFDGDRIPNLGDDTAFTLNLGLEFKF